MTMYQRIKDLRTLKGLSQQELATLTGYQDRSSIAKIESGVVDLTQSKIILFAKVLGVPPAELMGLSDNEDLRLTPHERDVILSYRAHPDAQPFVDKLLGVEPEPAALPKQA